MASKSQAKDDLKALDTEALVALAQSGRMSALEELVARHQKLVYVTLYQLAPERNDIHDLTQEVLLRVPLHSLPAQPKNVQVLAEPYYHQPVLRRVAQGPATTKNRFPG